VHHLIILQWMVIMLSLKHDVECFSQCIPVSSLFGEQHALLTYFIVQSHQKIAILLRAISDRFRFFLRNFLAGD